MGVQVEALREGVKWKSEGKNDVEVASGNVSDGRKRQVGTLKII